MAPPLVVFPDATKLALDFLRTQLGVHAASVDEVSNAVPRERPGTFVQVRRQGGVRATVVTDAATLDVECWAPKDEQAHDLAQLCRGLLLSMSGLVGGQRVLLVEEFVGLANEPDPLSKQPRYTFAVVVHVRGATPTP